MNFIIRKETKEDYQFTEQVVKKAFEKELYSDQNEHSLVSNLRNSDSFIPDLSLVALYNGKIIGHILLSKIFIINNESKKASLALAPMSVFPEYQNRGVGKRLISTALNKAKSLNFESVIVMGHSNYYPKFGFEKASKWSLKAPFEVSDEFLMAIELKENALKIESGIIEYPDVFFNH